MKTKHKLVKNTWVDVIKEDVTNNLDGLSMYELKLLAEEWSKEHGESCMIDFKWSGYEDLDVRLIKYCTESDEDFNNRIEEWEKEQRAKKVQSRKDKEAHLAKIEKEQADKEQAERDLLKKLKEKYGE